VDARKSLAALMAGTLEAWPFDPALDADETLAWAQSEGVVALVAVRLREGLAGTPEPVRRAFEEAARGDAARLMMRQAEARRVLAGFAKADIPVLLLKGSALAYWAWPAPYLRDCVDVDLLFASREAAMAAATLLASDGYVRRQHFGEAVTREFLCLRQMPNGSRLEMDMHWDLTSEPLFRDRFGFEALLASSIPLPTLSPDARGLSPVHALLHACVHRASNLASGGGDSLKWLYDLHLVAGALDEAGWETLCAQAVDRGLAGVCADGFSNAAWLFATPLPETAMAALRRASAKEALDLTRLRKWSYFQRQNLRALPGWRARLRWIWQRLRPTSHYREDVGVVGGGLLRDRVQRALRQLRRR
jgi:hypothetical protein